MRLHGMYHNPLHQLLDIELDIAGTAGQLFAWSSTGQACITRPALAGPDSVLWVDTPAGWGAARALVAYIYGTQHWEGRYAPDATPGVVVLINAFHCAVDHRGGFCAAVFPTSLAS